MIKQLASGGGANKIPIKGVIGQSNAEGTTALSTLPPEYAGSQSEILIWWPGLPSAPITPTFQNMVPGTNTVDPAHRDPVDNAVNWGVEQRASHYLQSRWNKKIYLFKNSFGGLAISYWDAGQSMWTQLNNYVTGITAWALAQGKIPEFKSVIFLQGEADVIASTSMVTYEAKYRSLITRFRAINSYTANTQWVAVKIRSGVIPGGTGETGLQAINTIFQNVANENPTLNKIITPESIGATGTDVHYSADGYLRIGAAWADLIS